MTYSNMRQIETRKANGREPMHFAIVDKTTGYWPMRKTRTLLIYRPLGSGYWRDIETGHWITDINRLAEAAEAMALYHATSKSAL